MGCGLERFRRLNLCAGAGGGAALHCDRERGMASMRAGLGAGAATRQRQSLASAALRWCLSPGLWGFRVAIWACWASRAGDGGPVGFTTGSAPARRAPAAGRRGRGRDPRRSAPGGGDAQPRRHPFVAWIADAAGGGALQRNDSLSGRRQHLRPPLVVHRIWREVGLGGGRRLGT